LLFNSLIFLIFGSCFFLVWPLFRDRQNQRWIFLIAASFFFYGWWDWRFLFLLVFSGMVDFLAGLAIAKYPARKKLFLLASMAGNLGCLGLFKYSRFVAENIDRLLGALDISMRLAPGVPAIMTVVPVGISFYTFQSMSYTVDVYRGEHQPTRNVLHFFSYLALFPQLVAGPIVRARDLLPQLTRDVRASENDRWEGLRLVVYGYFKKVVIADNMAPIVNAAFGSPSLERSSVFWWIIVSMFALQIYCDFSGYSDIARGLGRWMGYDFMLNFDHPYISRSLREFWQRWHISLSTWFKDYVYVSMGGSRTGRLKTYRNIWVTMLLSGLWHGAAWTFIAWSAVHAFFLSIERLSRWPQRISRFRGGALAAWTIVMVQVWVAWVLFRAQSLAQAGKIVMQMFSFDLSPFHTVDAVLFLKALVLAAFWALVETLIGLNISIAGERSGSGLNYFSEALLAGMIAACIYLRGPGSAFIYFQF
jgi:alginate O-acetyltransferase complex protein AlgI